MYHFYVESSAIADKKARITGSDYNHIKNVLRMKKGEEILICDRQNREFRCMIAEIGGAEILCDIISERETEAELGTRLFLFQGLPKKDKMEFIIQKAVELGVYEIIPVITKYTVVKLEDEKKESKKRERWQSIAEAAAKQSGRGIIPNVTGVLSFRQALQKMSGLDTAVVPYEHAEGMDSAHEFVKSVTGKKSVGILIGPEGGFDESEIEACISQGIHPISLGKRILRTETAGLCILSVLMFELADQ